MAAALLHHVLSYACMHTKQCLVFHLISLMFTTNRIMAMYVMRNVSGDKELCVKMMCKFVQECELMALRQVLSRAR